MKTWPIQIGFATPVTDARMRLLAQMGATAVVTSLPGMRPGEVWPFEAMLAQRRRVESFGLELKVYEGIPITDRIKLGLEGSDQDLENFCQSLRNMGRAGIPILCYNWMVHFNWIRTSLHTRTRGGALVTAYRHADFERGGLTGLGQVSEDLLWETLEHFLQRVVPIAEAEGVRLAMHPCDPPLSPVRGIGRIMTSPENFQRLLGMVDSPANGLTFCQGCFAEMGCDVPAWIRRFAAQGRLHFAHFRNVNRGATTADFHEVFHDDEGQADMWACMQAYIDAGFAGPMRPDHAPTMEGEDNDHPGYETQGRLLAVGYMKGLMEGIVRSRQG